MGAGCWFQYVSLFVKLSVERSCSCLRTSLELQPNPRMRASSSVLYIPGFVKLSLTKGSSAYFLQWDFLVQSSILLLLYIAGYAELSLIKTCSGLQPLLGLRWRCAPDFVSTGCSDESTLGSFASMRLRLWTQLKHHIDFCISQLAWNCP